MRRFGERSERGSEIVQFVVAVPLLLLVMFSIMQIGGMMLATSQVSSQVTRACRQLDVGGFERATDKATFVRREVLGSVTQLRPENLQVDHVEWQRRQERSSGSHDEGVLEQRTSVASISYDVAYRLPAIADLPGLSGRTIARHVDCSLVDGRVIEVELGAA